MGVAPSIPKELCITVPPYVINETYTVTRTSGAIEAGWRVSTENQCFHAGITSNASKHGLKTPGIWRIYMNNGQDNANLHVCGWRRIETIYPSRFVGCELAIAAWRVYVVELLDDLEEKRAN